MSDKKLIIRSSYSKRALGTMTPDEVNCRVENRVYLLIDNQDVNDPWRITKNVYDAITKWQTDSNDNSDFEIDVSELTDRNYVRETEIRFFSHSIESEKNKMQYFKILDAAGEYGISDANHKASKHLFLVHDGRVVDTVSEPEIIFRGGPDCGGKYEYRSKNHTLWVNENAHRGITGWKKSNVTSDCTLYLEHFMRHPIMGPREKHILVVRGHLIARRYRADSCVCLAKNPDGSLLVKFVDASEEETVRVSKKLHDEIEKWKTLENEAYFIINELDIITGDIGNA